MRLLFVIPTTGGPLVVTALRPRPGLPASAAFAEGDFGPLPWSGRYGSLCAPGGPFFRAIPHLAPHELRLSASFDAGRSWEAPVALAHLLLAQGHACAARPAEAEAIIWTTGAIDLDLALIHDDYALSDKIEKTAALLAEVPETTPIFVILPPDPDAEAAWTRLQAIANARPVMRIAAVRMAEVAAAFLQRMAPADAAPTVDWKPPPRVRWPAMAAAAAVGVAGGLGTYAHYRATPERQNLSEPAPSSRVVISEIRAATGKTCRQALFDRSARVRHAVSPLDDTTFTPSRLEDALCGIAIKLVVATDRVTAEEGDLKAEIKDPAPEPGDAISYFLHDKRPQNIVYQIHVSGETESGQPRTDVIHHAIVR